MLTPSLRPLLLACPLGWVTAWALLVLLLVVLVRFAVYNGLGEALPRTDDFKMKLLRSAFIGFCASAASDCISNSVRVIKVSRTTTTTTGARHMPAWTLRSPSASSTAPLLSAALFSRCGPVLPSPLPG